MLFSHPLTAFFQGLGYRVEQAGGLPWREAGALAWMAEPSGAVPQGGIPETRALLRRTHKLAAIFCTAQPSGKTVPLFTVADKAYGPQSVQRQFWQHVRRGRAVGDVRPLSWEEWREAGLACDLATLGRRGGSAQDHPLLDPIQRRHVAEVAAATPGLEIYGCFAASALVAYLVCWVHHGVGEGLVMHWSDHDSGLRASHLLYYEATCLLLARPDVEQVRIGRQSVPGKHSLDQFKRHAGYREMPCHVGVLIHPWLAPFLENPLSSQLLRWLRHRWPRLAALEVLELAWPTYRALKAAARTG